jgi:hypothetical protein
VNLRIRARLVPLFGAIVLNACGGDDPISITQGGCLNILFGTFTGNATSTAAGSLSGCAYYSVATNTSSQQQTFALVLTNQNGSTASPTISLGRNGGRPGTGTYSVSTTGTNNFIGTISVDPNRGFVASSGSVTITASSSSGVSGSVNITGNEVGTSSTITVTGDFSAKCFQSTQSGTTFSC